MAVPGRWEHVQITGPAFSAVVAVATQSLAAGEGCLWELRPFYYHLCKRPLHKWLAGHGRQDDHRRLGGGVGAQAVLAAAERICPALRPCLALSQRQQDARSHRRDSAPTAGLPTDRPAPARAALDGAAVSCRETFPETMVSLGWLLPFLLHFAVASVKATVQQAALNTLQTFVGVLSNPFSILADGGDVPVQNGEAPGLAGLANCSWHVHIA